MSLPWARRAQALEDAQARLRTAQHSQGVGRCLFPGYARSRPCYFHTTSRYLDVKPANAERYERRSKRRLAAMVEPSFVISVNAAGLTPDRCAVSKASREHEPVIFDATSMLLGASVTLKLFPAALASVRDQGHGVRDIHVAGSKKPKSSAPPARWAGRIATATDKCAGPDHVLHGRSARVLRRDVPTATVAVAAEQTPVDDPGEGLDPRAAQILLEARPPTPASFPPGHQHDLRVCGILQPHQRRRDRLPGRGRRFAQSSRGDRRRSHPSAAACGRRRRVEHDERAAPLPRRCARRRGRRRPPRCRASAGLRSSSAALCVEVLATRAAIICSMYRSVSALGRSGRPASPSILARERRRKVRRRIGGAQVDVWPRSTSPMARRPRSVVLPTPPLPITMISPRPAARARRPDRRARAMSGARIGAISGAAVASLDLRRAAPQRRQADHVERSQRHAVLRQGSQASGISASAAWPAPRSMRASRIDGSLAVNTPLTARRWLLSPSARSSPPCAPPRERALVGACRRARSVVRAGSPERRQGSLEALLLHLQPRMRSEARGPAVVAVEKAGPGLGQAQQAQACVRSARCRRRRGRSPGRRRRRAGELVEGRDLVVQAPESCSRTVARSASWPRHASAPAPARDRPRPPPRGRCSWR